MAFFLRKSTPRDPLAVEMTAARMGERLLQVGADDRTLPGALAVKVGLSGEAASTVPDAATAALARQAAERAGALMDVHVGLEPPLPYATDHFDLVVCHSQQGLLSARPADARVALLADLRRVLRPGGRILVLEAGQAEGLGRLTARGGDPESYRSAGGAEPALREAGFKPVRLLVEREGIRFFEGLKAVGS